jgi:hypothetical protein
MELEDMTKIFYKLTQEQQMECLEFIKIKKLNMALSDFIIDGLRQLVLNNTNQAVQLISSGQLTQKELDEEKFAFTESVPEGQGGQRVIVLTGSKLLEGLIQAFKVSNIMGRENNMKTHKKLENYIQDYIQGQMAFIHTHLLELALEDEVKATKETTKKTELEQATKAAKAKIIKENE